MIFANSKKKGVANSDTFFFDLLTLYFNNLPSTPLKSKS